MKRLNPLMAIALACCCVTARAEETLAVLKTVSGPVQVLRKGAALPASAGMALQVADRIVAPAGATAGISFRDGTRVAVGPSSELLLRNYVFRPKDAVYAFDLHLAHGSALYSSGTLAKVAPTTVKISTPNAMIGVRGTLFIVEAD